MIMITAYIIDKKIDRCGMWEKHIAKLQKEGNKQEKVLETTVTMSDVYCYLF